MPASSDTISVLNAGAIAVTAIADSIQASATLKLYASIDGINFVAFPDTLILTPTKTLGSILMPYATAYRYYYASITYDAADSTSALAFQFRVGGR
jgi:hypothetical protein